MNERPHPTAEDFLAFCDREIAKVLLLPASMASGKAGMSYAAAKVHFDIMSARMDAARVRR